MTLTMPPLPYEPNALEPMLSESQVDYHYNKHTKKYYDTCNKLLHGTTFQKNFTSLHDLIRNPAFIHTDSKLYHSACQAWNHTFFWDNLCPIEDAPTIPEALEREIKNNFSSIDEFKNKIIEKGTDLFGSGWIWVYVDGSSIKIKASPNSGNPLSNPRHFPILTIDVWEHAYLYDPQYVADRPRYIENMLKIINWNIVAERLTQARKRDSQ